MARSGPAFVVLVVGGLALSGCASRVCCPPPGPAPTARGAGAAERSVLVEASIVRMSVETAATVVGEPPDARPVRVLSGPEAAALWARLGAAAGVETVALPAIVAVADQEASIWIGEIAPGVVPPSTGLGGGAWDGVEVRLTPTPSGDGASLALDVAVRVRTPTGAGPATADDLSASAGIASMPSGSAVVLVLGGPFASSRSRTLAIVTPRVLAAAPASATDGSARPSAAGAR